MDTKRDQAHQGHGAAGGQEAVLPAEQESAYVEPAERVDVDFLFAHREMRKMDCGGSISYKGRTYAPNTPEKAFMARSDVEVRESLSGKIWVIHKGRRIEMREVEKAERAAPSNATKGNEGEPAKTHTPAPNHPWKQSFQEKRSPWLSEECLKDGFFSGG